MTELAVLTLPSHLLYNWVELDRFGGDLPDFGTLPKIHSELLPGHNLTI